MNALSDEANQERSRWDNETSDSAAWDARKVASRLRKGGQLGEAIRFAEDCLKHWPTFEPIRNELAWSLYSRDLGPLEPETADAGQRDTAKSSLERIQDLCAATPYDTFSAWPQATLKLATIALGRWPLQAIKLLETLDPAQLSGQGTGEYPSLCTRWHLNVTKSLKELERWDDLLAACDTALDGSKLRDQDRPWVRRRWAIALHNLGRHEESATILMGLRSEMRKWWLEADLARALAGAGQPTKAMDACRRSLCFPGELSARWETVFLLGQLAEAEDDITLAHSHYSLARHLRVQSGWPAHPELDAAAARLGETGEPPLEFDLNDVRTGWQAAEDASRVSGVVKVVLPEGKSGFLTPDSGSEDLYFAMTRGASEPAPPVGTHVTFRVIDGFDKKKNAASRKAIDLRVE
ncbi:hypothetical protein OAM92_00400 [Acidimicrobiales bacterium]|nr:hypothetical protein [Acidimicrobiales bacterium]